MGDQLKTYRQLYDANKIVYDTQENVRHTVLGALNIVVPAKYKRSINATRTGVVSYRNTKNLRDISNGLKEKYGKPTS